MPWIHRIECIFYPSEFWRTCTCPEKQNLRWNFSLYWNIFYLSGFLSRGGGRSPRPPASYATGDTKCFVHQNVLSYQYSCRNLTAKILPRNSLRSAKFESFPDVHDKKTVWFRAYFLGHCASQWNPRDMIINWNCIILLPIISISEIHVQNFYFLL